MVDIKEGSNIDDEHALAVGRGVLQATEDAKVSAYKLQCEIYDNANPHPAYVLGVAAGIVLCIWLLYTVAKPAELSGEWYDSHGTKYHFKQRGEEVTVTSMGQISSASFKRGVFKFGPHMGIYDQHNAIEALRGLSFYRA
jgi:hypothetical protein